MNKNFIVQQGYKPIFISLVITFGLYIVDLEFLGALGFVVTLLLVYIYRDTERYIYENSTNILAPIDGKIIAIDHGKHKNKIYVQVCLLNNHNIRAPFNSNCELKSKQHGLNLDPMSSKGCLLNEQMQIKFHSKEYEDKRLKLKLISGLCNPSISIDLNESYDQGDKVGLFIHGIAEIILKKDMDISVAINEKIKAGQTIISQLD